MLLLAATTLSIAYAPSCIHVSPRARIDALPRARIAADTAMTTTETETEAVRKFYRTGDFFNSGESVSAVDIVNVIGRWKTLEDWNGIGVLVEMDQLFNANGVVTDGPALQRAWERWDAAYVAGKDPVTLEKMLKVKGDPAYRAENLPVWMAGADRIPKRDPLFGDYQGLAQERLKGPQPDAARSAARRGFCIRRGQAQRWWHNEHLSAGLLPFTNEAMARSVGKTAAELDATPPTWEACDVVFDALSRSQSGLVEKSLVAERKAGWETADGGFDADAFARDLATGRSQVAISLCIFPGSLNVIGGITFIQADGISASLDALNQLQATVNGNLALWGLV